MLLLKMVISPSLRPLFLTGIISSQKNERSLLKQMGKVGEAELSWGRRGQGWGELGNLLLKENIWGH